MIFLLANDYQEAKAYAYAHDLSAQEYRYVSRISVFGAAMQPKVVVVGPADQVPEEILDALVNKEAEVEYATG